MQICRTVKDMRSAVNALRSRGRIGLVPTMGALHAGHMALVARAQENSEAVCATIFVNPTQFENPEDLEKYPNTLEADLQMLKAAGVAAVFIPQASEIYPEGAETIVDCTGLSGVLHGLFGFWALAEVFDGRRSSLVLVGGLIAKVAWEQFYGPSTSTAAMIGARVAVDAHLFGAIGGLSMAWLEKLTHRRIFG